MRAPEKRAPLSAIREGAEQGGYKVEGFAPTSKAAGQLREAGIEANTLQSFLARQKEPDPASKHLYMLDESSLASTKQMRAFLEKIRPQDRVLVIGDIRQHQGVDAGRPFQQMQEAGMQTSKLDTIMRQKDPELLRAVQYLATNETEKGIALLSEARADYPACQRARAHRSDRAGLRCQTREHPHRLPRQSQPTADQ